MRLALVATVVLTTAFKLQSPEVRQAPGAATSVPPKPTPAIPEGNTGLASQYPGDAGIEKDPDVVFAENFEGSVEEICSRWDQVAGQAIMSKSEDVPPGSGGKQSLLLTRVAGGTGGYTDGGNLYRRLKNGKGGYGHGQLFFRVMVKMNDVGDSNGEQAYWLDGKLSRKGDMITSYLGKGFPSVGTWTFDKFAPGVNREGIAWDYARGKGVPIKGGKPFPGFAWRSVPELNINAIWLYRYMDPPEPGTSKVWWDHLVVAKKYIGPLTPVRK